MSPAQITAVTLLLLEFRQIDVPSRLIHGACSGADREAHLLMDWREMFPAYREQEEWARRESKLTDIVHPRNENPILRNRKMVDEGDMVIAAPKGMVEQFRGSGTWATIRYARKTGKPLYICWPDGTVTVEKEYGQ